MSIGLVEYLSYIYGKHAKVYRWLIKSSTDVHLDPFSEDAYRMLMLVSKHEACLELICKLLSEGGPFL